MLKIQGDVWREDCVAMIGLIDDDDCVVQVVIVGGGDSYEYEFDTPEEAVTAKEELVKQWEAFFASNQEK